MLARRSCWSERWGLGGFGVLEANASQRCLEALVRVEASQNDTLVTDQPRRAIDRMRVAALDLEVRLAADHEEAAGFVKAIVYLRQPRGSTNNYRQTPSA